MTATQKISASDLATDASWLPHKLDMARRVISFGQFSRGKLSQGSFLDYRIENAASGWAEASFDDLFANAAALKAAKPLFLFHTSYCCSTLLARALDRPGEVLALKEPEIIMGLSNAYRLAQSQDEFDEVHRLRDLLLSLIARPHEGDECVLVKPTNAANNLFPILASLGIPMILLYGDLRGFLASVIKKGDPCKTLIRQIYRVYAMDNIGVAAIPQRDALALTDLQIAALVWRHQVEMFNAVLGASSSANVRSLDFQTFLARPAETLNAASNHLGLNMDNETCREIAGGPLFQTDAKNDKRTYNAVLRAEEERALNEQNNDALDLIENWAFNLSLWTETTKQLPQPLLT